jgi:hypothetical protein
MLSKVVKYIILFIAIFLWLQAYSPLIYKSSGLFEDDYRYGDLYRLSYLPQFKQRAEHCKTIRSKSENPQSANLYIIGDSFTEAERVNKQDFFAKKYEYVHWAKQKKIDLDTTQRNILILETVERTFKDHFTNEVNNFTIAENPKPEEPQKSWKQRFLVQEKKIISYVFPSNEEIEQRLEHTLFNYDFFLWFRELKSTINNTFFDRVEKKVVLSTDKSHLFYFEEADSTDSHSAFYPVSSEEIEHYVNQINGSREKYLKAGFDEVYLSIIPNKVSILDPNLGKYNHLIERIQRNPNLKTPIISVLGEFKTSPTKYYLISDTHWTCEGRDLWLNKVNNILTKIP